MLPHAKYRHSDYCTASHAGVTDVTTTREHGCIHPPTGQTTRHPILKRFFNQACDRYQKVYVATGPADKIAEDTCGLGKDLHTYFRQYPPPTKGPTTMSRARWKLNWQHPPPKKGNGERPPGMIRSKDPPPKLMVYSLLYGGLSSHLMRPDITEHSHRGDKLTLASQHPPPTKGRTTVNRARWKVNWQQPPPTTRGVARNLIAAVTSLRSISLRLRVMCITVQGNITFFLIEAGAALYYQKFLYPQRTYVKLKQLHCSFSFVLRALLVTPKAVISRAIYSNNMFAYLTGLEDGSMLTNPINHNRQILPSYTEFNDHVCLVGNTCLVSKSRTRKRYSL